MNLDDYKIDWFSGTGKGGQHRNKHQNCCRVTHIETGIKANGTNSRSREDNLRNALAVCNARIAAANHEETERYRATNERVRTYNVADNRVTDHASGLSMSYKDVTKKGIGELVQARLMAKGDE